ncbi:hypothetical protein IMSHALPRED_001340 [Imshaugia aleurites]|uniref:Thioesterase domain-containing protein n=1 Tax=Imshaugia aleurites TaxID=172621 RepID=A0A8H3J299_9LECA|nr:hypothetical protein IMSHALPRED_001340 [Imshaugia aleurites]
MALTKSKEDAMNKIREDFGSFIEWVQQRDTPQFDGTIMAEARLVDASPSGKAVFEMDIGDKYSNLRGTMHGAAAALIFDNLSAAAFLPLIPSAKEQRKSVGQDFLLRGDSLTLKGLGKGLLEG